MYRARDRKVYKGRTEEDAIETPHKEGQGKTCKKRRHRECDIEAGSSVTLAREAKTTEQAQDYSRVSDSGCTSSDSSTCWATRGAATSPPASGLLAQPPRCSGVRVSTDSWLWVAVP